MKKNLLLFSAFVFLAAANTFADDSSSQKKEPKLQSVSIQVGGEKPEWADEAREKKLAQSYAGKYVKKSFIAVKANDENLKKGKEIMAKAVFSPFSVYYGYEIPVYIKNTVKSKFSNGEALNVRETYMQGSKGGRFFIGNPMKFAADMPSSKLSGQVSFYDGDSLYVIADGHRQVKKMDPERGKKAFFDNEYITSFDGTVYGALDAYDYIYAGDDVVNGQPCSVIKAVPNGSGSGRLRTESSRHTLYLYADKKITL